ncbi:MAG: dihydrofolate reductase [Candidatus Paceibacterota bacterium]
MKAPLTNKTISLITAMDSKYTIGRGNRFPWNPTSVPADMKRFVELTEKKALIVGRKTGMHLPESMLERIPVIILTRTPTVPDDGKYQTAGTVREATTIAEEAAPDADEIMIGGGAEIYDLFLPFADKIYLTLIDKQFQSKADDVYFPVSMSELKQGGWDNTEQFFYPKNEENKWNLSFITMERG